MTSVLVTGGAVFIGSNFVRDWLHVDNHCSAVDLVSERGTDGEGGRSQEDRPARALQASAVQPSRDLLLGGRLALVLELVRGAESPLSTLNGRHL
jgi:hypothetical protein